MHATTNTTNTTNSTDIVADGTSGALP